MLGIIAGENSLPKYLINKLINNNSKFLILDLTKSNNFKLFLLFLKQTGAKSI
mgnify:CR=1 FL=1